MKIGKEMAKKGLPYPTPIFPRHFQNPKYKPGFIILLHVQDPLKYLLNGYNIFSNSMENSVSYLGYFSISFEKKLHTDLSF